MGVGWSQASAISTQHLFCPPRSQFEVEKTIHDVGLIDVADAVKVGCLFVYYEREEGEQAVERHDEDDPNDVALLHGGRVVAQVSRAVEQRQGATDGRDAPGDGPGGGGVHEGGVPDGSVGGLPGRGRRTAPASHPRHAPPIILI